MSITPDEISRIQRFEGSIPHLYRDSGTKGNVTIGYGHLIANAGLAQSLNFIHTRDGTKATPADILAEWNTIISKPFGQAYGAGYYAPFCILELQQTDINKMLNSDLAATEQQLKTSFPNYTQFPQSAQAGLIDMGFNLGVQGMLTKFAPFVAAVRKKDWATAANTCNRPQLSAPRNTEVKQLFLAAVPKPTKPSHPSPTRPGHPSPTKPGPIPPTRHPDSGSTGSSGSIAPHYLMSEPHFEAPVQAPAPLPPVAAIPGAVYSYNFDCQGIVAIVAMQSNVTTAAITAITAIACEKK